MILRTPKVVREKKRAAKEWKKKYKEKTTVISGNVIEKQNKPKVVREQDDVLTDLYKLFKIRKDYKVVGLSFYINKDLEAYNFDQIRDRLINKQTKFKVYRAKKI